MKKLILFALVICCQSAIAQSTATAQQSAAGKTSKYLPIEDQIIYKGKVQSYDTNNKIIAADVNSLSHDKTMLKNFPNTLSTVSVMSVDDNGNYNIVPNGIAVEKGNYQVIYEYSVFQPVVCKADSARLTLCVGASIRLVANITTLAPNVDIGKIMFTDYAEGKSRKITGSIQIALRGINSQTLSNFCPIPINGATFSEANFNAALQAINVIKSHFSDADVMITPEVLGFYHSSKDAADKGGFADNVSRIKDMMNSNALAQL